MAALSAIMGALMVMGPPELTTNPPPMLMDALAPQLMVMGPPMVMDRLPPVFSV